MKTINSLRLILSLIALTAFMLVLKSCKKDDSSTINNEAEASRVAAIKATKVRYGNISAEVIYKVNKDAEELFYRDA